jgi:hypothetical protein
MREGKTILTSKYDISSTRVLSRGNGAIFDDENKLFPFDNHGPLFLMTVMSCAVLNGLKIQPDASATRLAPYSAIVIQSDFREFTAVYSRRIFEI